MANNGKIVVLSGPSGVGKSTVRRYLQQHYRTYGISVSVTTRAPREGEQEGVNYYYRTRRQYDELVRQGAFVEHAERYGNCYGTLYSEIDRLRAQKHVVLDIEYVGALNIKAKYPDAILIFLLPPSFDALYGRIDGRGSETAESLQERFSQAQAELQYAKQYDYILVNHEVSKCAWQVHQIVRCTQCATQDNIQLINDLIGGKKLC